MYFKRKKFSAKQKVETGLKPVSTPASDRKIAVALSSLGHWNIPPDVEERMQDRMKDFKSNYIRNQVLNFY